MLGLRLVEPLADKARRDLADVRHGAEFLEARGHELVQRAEVRGEHLACLLADLADAKGADQARETRGFAIFYGGHEVCRRLFAHVVELCDLVGFEVIDARGRGQKPGLYERVRHGDAEALDVHRLTRGEVHDVSEPLRRALGARAAHGDAVLIPDDGRAALRADVRQVEGHSALGPLALHDLEHLGDDLPRFTDDNRVAYADVQLVDEVLIVQRGVRHRRPREADRFDDSLGCEHAGAADLDDDILHDALLALRRVLIGRRPARGLGRAAQLLALGEGVYLDDRAVYVVGEVPPVLAYGLDRGLAFLKIVADGVGHGVKAEFAQRVERLRVGGEVPAYGFLDVEDADVELARGGDLRVLLAHGARGGVARVCKQRLASELALGVELLEHRAGHVDLTADDEPLRGVFELLRQVPHGAEVLGDVLAGHSVAACSTADKHAVFILQ